MDFTFWIELDWRKGCSLIILACATFYVFLKAGSFFFFLSSSSPKTHLTFASFISLDSSSPHPHPFNKTVLNFGSIDGSTFLCYFFFLFQTVAVGARSTVKSPVMRQDLFFWSVITLPFRLNALPSTFKGKTQVFVELWYLIYSSGQISFPKPIHNPDRHAIKHPLHLIWHLDSSNPRCVVCRNSPRFIPDYESGMMRNIEVSLSKILKSWKPSARPIF